MKVVMRCEHCAQLFSRFLSQSKAARFCSRACKDAARTAASVVGVKCESCGTTFRRNRARISEHVFCSRACADVAPHDRDRVMLTCPGCGRVHERPRSHAHKTFCSMPCLAAFKGRATKVRVHAGQREFVCKHCQGTFFRTREGAGYCSKDCSVLAQRGRERMPRTDPQQCIGCLLFKPLAASFSRIAGSGLYSRRCKECRARTGTSPEAKRRSHLRIKFGMSLEEWFAMYDAQRGCCAICAKQLPDKSLMVAPAQRRSRWTTRDWNTDHCHKTGRVRGILCRACNQALGSLRDDPAVARAAAMYLEQHAPPVDKIDPIAA